MDALVVQIPPSPPPTPAPPEASLSTQERLRLAKRRRAAQLKRWTQRERERGVQQAGQQLQPDLLQGTGRVRHRHGRRLPANIRFVSSVMLLESAARNDVEEVRRLLEAGVSPDSTNEDGLTALHQVSIRQQRMSHIIMVFDDMNSF